MIDRNSPVPLYYQLYTILLTDIKSSAFKPGDMLPTEVSLMEKYDLSRSTVRQAILDLARNGYVVREKSRGTFVKDFSTSLSYKDKVKGFGQISYLDGRKELTNKVLEQKVISVPAYICEHLKIKPGTKVFYLKRVRSIDGKPVVYAEDWVRYEKCKGIEHTDFITNSLLDVLENQFGIISHHAVRTFECCNAESQEQVIELNLKKNQPLLHLTSLIQDKQSNPIEVCLAVINGRYTAYE